MAIGLSPDGTKLVVGSGNDGYPGGPATKVSIYDVSGDTFSLLGSVQLADEPQQQICFSPDSQHVYIPTRSWDATPARLYEVSLTEPFQVSRWEDIEASSRVGSVVTDGETLFVSDCNLPKIWTLDLATMTQSGSIDVPFAPYYGGMAIHPDGEHLFVLHSDDAALSVIDLDTYSVVGSSDDLIRPTDIQFTSNGKTAYVAEYSMAGGGITVLNVATEADEWQVIYETDFSSDPGWITNDSSRFHWSESDETYYANPINVNFGGHYAYTEVNYHGGDFRLECDMMADRVDYATILHFDMFDSTNIGRDLGGQRVRAALHTEDRGRTTLLQWLKDADHGHYYRTSPQWSPDTWYSFVMEYDASASTLDLEITVRDTGQPWASIHLENVEPLDAEMNRLGSTHYSPTGNYQVPGAQAWGKFDNVVLMVPATSSRTYAVLLGSRAPAWLDDGTEVVDGVRGDLDVDHVAEKLNWSSTSIIMKRQWDDPDDIAGSIQGAVNGILEEITQNDTLLFYYAGHGSGSSWPFDNDEINAVDGSSYLDNTLTSVLSDGRLADVKKVVLLDSCRSGGFWNDDGLLDNDLNTLSKVAFLAAAEEDEDTTSDADGTGTWTNTLLPYLTQDVTFQELANQVEIAHTNDVTGFFRSIEGGYGTVPWEPVYYFSPDFDAAHWTLGGSVEPANAPEIVNLSLTPMVFEGHMATLTAEFIDADVSDIHTADIDWSHGPPSPGVVTEEDGSGTVEASHVYVDDDVYPVTLTVADDHGDYDTETDTVLVLNVAPSASVSGPDSAVRAQARTFTFSATDPSPVDQMAGFRFEIDWGDTSQVQTIDASSGLQLEHVYADQGVYTVEVTATDKDGGTSQPVSHTITIGGPVPGVDLHDGALQIVGTDKNDHVFVQRTRRGQLLVFADFLERGERFQRFSTEEIEQIDIRLYDGRDHATVGRRVNIPAYIDGGPGRDILSGGSSHDILIGGEGRDRLFGYGGSDLLIGGPGTDQLMGGFGDDLLVAGTTAFDANDEALRKIMEEWTSGRDYGIRVQNIRGEENDYFEDRLNEDYFLVADGGNATVFDDDARDLLNGGRGQDWYFTNYQRDDDGKRDRVHGRRRTEFVDDLDLMGVE